MRPIGPVVATAVTVVADEGTLRAEGSRFIASECAFSGYKRADQPPDTAFMPSMSVVAGSERADQADNLAFIADNVASRLDDLAFIADNPAIKPTTLPKPLMN